MFGTRCLELLDDKPSRAVIERLRLRPESPAEMEVALQGVSYRVLVARVRDLVHRGVIEPAREPSQEECAHGTRYQLTEAGRAILPVISTAVRCQQKWPVRQNSYGPQGAAAISLAGDVALRIAARALAHEPMRVGELAALLPEARRSTLKRRLAEAAALGVLASRKEGRAVWYDLNDEARCLSLLVLKAAAWEWGFGEVKRELLSSDIAGLIHQIAPLARLPKDVNGVCLLHEDWHRTLQSDVYVVARAGRLTTPLVALGHRDAEASGSPDQWARALIANDPSAIVAGGDRQLVAMIIEALHATLEL
jgi:DNA-binding HxlR family transcriptional regulator